MNCDFCSTTDTVPAYTVPGSALGMIVHVCRGCGLVQSVATMEKAPGPRVVSTSSDANWGNIRHGKGLRFKAALPVLAQVPWDHVAQALDVGANRGDFVSWLHTAHPASRVVGVEPDAAVVDSYRSLPNLTLHLERIENVSLPAEHFDFVYCSHTLEHADSASAMLRQIHASLRVGGFLFLEVPNLEVLSIPDIVEEFFIDKHRFHFDRVLLGAFLRHLGFQAVHGDTADDCFNITFLLQKEGPIGTTFVPPRATLAAENQELLARYARALVDNRGRLKQVVEKVSWFSGRQKVAFWGAGRLLDVLIRHGGLDASKSWGVVDEYLWKILPEVHGLKVRRPEELKMNPPDVVIVLARSSAAEIAAKARKFGIRKIITFSDLIQSAV